MVNIKCVSRTFLSLLYIAYSDAANILFVIPFAAKSHYISLRPIGLELARRGHNVTVITGFKEETYPSNYHQVLVKYLNIWDKFEGGRPNVFTMVDLNAEEFHRTLLWPSGLALTENALQSPEVQQLFASDVKFDLIINEQFFQEAFYALAHKYDAPLALVTTYGNCMKHNFVTRNPLQWSTVTFEFLTVENPTSFLGRLRNIYFSIYEFIWWKFWYLEKQEQLMKKYIPGLPVPVPSLYKIQMNTSLTLLNSHFSIDTTAAYLPNVIEIGGIHLTESNSSLPKDLQKYLDEAEYGVVYMNFGSNIKSTELPKEKRQAFINVFKSLKQTVLFKWEDNYMDDKPDNVIIREWLPQREILAHPNIKVFISHGGLIGTHEAIHSGVPVIGIPIYSDQLNNLLLLQEMGMGKLLKYHDITEERLNNLLQEVLYNDSYMKKAKEISKRFKDRPMSALDSAMYWLEYVIRNNGATYMRNPANELNWFAYTMLDIFIVLTFTIIASIYIFINLITMVKSITGKKTKEHLKCS